MKRYSLILVLLFSAYSLSAQDTARIFLKTRVQKNGVLLRWAPDSPAAWSQTNRTGFIVERYTLVRDGEVLDRPEKIILSGDILKAQPLDNWMLMVEQDDNAAIIAQALYGDSFEVSGEEKGTGATSIIQLSKDQEQRFIFSLYAADQSFEAAIMAGWGWKDKRVNEGERYLYRVLPAGQDEGFPIEAGTSFISMDEYQELPAVKGLAALWGDKSVTLMWDYSALSSEYNSYFIERSSDGRLFKRLPGSPVTNIDNKEHKEWMMYVDTLPDNHTDWHYRVKGINTFGEIGPPSDTVQGKGKTAVPYIPVISKTNVTEAGILELEWSFDEKGMELILGFELQKSHHVNGPYETVKENLSPYTRYLEYDRLNASNYFIIAARTKENELKRSFPVLVQPVDSIPPSAPTGLSAEIDSLGIVRLSWTPNTESDLMGYQVYRCHFLREEPAFLFDNYITDSFYTDTVELKSLNQELFYYVVALDQRYNKSDFSTPLRVKKPDIIPPVSPVISGYHVQDGGIEIEWVNSTDADVMEHLLYRKQPGEESERVIKRFPGKSIDRYRDTDIKAGIRYTYTIFAIDSSGLQSIPSPALTAFSRRNSQSLNEISKFDAVIDRQNLMIRLQWSSDFSNVKAYELYRARGEEPISLWKSLPGTDSEVTDEQIILGNSYRYILRAIFSDGRNSRSKELIIENLF